MVLEVAAGRYRFQFVRFGKTRGGTKEARIIVDVTAEMHENLRMTQRRPLFKRFLKIDITPNSIKGSGAAFLWGPRQTGKTTLLAEQFPDAERYDLLDTALAAELTLRPRRLREDVVAKKPAMVVVDEVQKVPDLLEEVHWLLENTPTRFVLCGSSPRKLRREARNLLGGRAVEHYLFPLTSREVPDIDSLKVLRHGCLPVHYLVERPAPLLKAYVNTYIKEEVIDEALTRNVPAFARFLQVLGLTHGQQLNFANVARECGVAPSTVRSYFQLLEDTLIGFQLEPWRRARTRRLVETSKFYLFDVGVANYLHPEARVVAEGSDLFGRAFEHFLLNEVRACLAYRQIDCPMAYWRTSSGFEVDLVLGDMRVALEFKAAKEVRAADLKGLRALKDEFHPKRSMVVTREPGPRTTEDGIELVPWQDFCTALWDGAVV